MANCVCRACSAALALPAAQLGALDGALRRRRQAREVVLEHVVHGPGGDGRHGGVLGDRAGDGDGRHVRRRLGEHVQRPDAAETRQVVVDQRQVPRLAGERLAQRGLGVDALPLRLDAGFAQAPQHELDVVGAVVDEQDAKIHQTCLWSECESAQRIRVMKPSVERPHGARSGDARQTLAAGGWAYPRAARQLRSEEYATGVEESLDEGDAAPESRGARPQHGPTASTGCLVVVLLVAFVVLVVLPAALWLLGIAHGGA